MTTEEMGVVGMSLNKDGFWVRKKMSEEARLSRHRNSTSVQNGEDDSTLTFGVKTPQMMDMEG